MQCPAELRFRPKNPKGFGISGHRVFEGHDIGGAGAEGVLSGCRSNMRRSVQGEKLDEDYADVYQAVP